MQTKRVLILIVFLSLLAVGCSGTAAVFKTPEDAIQHYFEGLAQNDIRKILEACAINEISEKFKFDLFAEFAGYLVPYSTELPTEYPFYVELNKSQTESQILRSVRFFALGLLSSEELGTGQPIKMETERISKFIKDVDPKGLSSLKVKRIDLSNKKLMNEAQYLRTADKMAKSYGADESTERVVLFSFNQNDYYVGFTLLRYGDNWKIGSQVSPIVSTPALGLPTKTTTEEYENMVNQ